MDSTATPHAVDPHDTRRRIFAIVGASSGNLVEWFDLYVYAFSALYFAPAFFPSGDRTTQLLMNACARRPSRRHSSALRSRASGRPWHCT